MEKKYINVKPTTNMLTLQLNFVSEYREVSLNANVYDFSVDSIDKYDILSIRKYLMTKNNQK